MPDRRKVERKPLVAYTQVYDLYGGQLLGSLAEITPLGIMVIGDRPLAKNTNVTLAIEVPDLEGIKASRMVIPARVVWSDVDISPNFFNVGFEFLEVKPEQAHIIEAIMKEYELQHKVPNYAIKPSPSQR